MTWQKCSSVRGTFKIISLTTMLSVGAGLQTASAEDLWDIYQLALQNDAQYAAAAANYEAAKVDLPLAKTGFRPTITSSATLGKSNSDASGTSVTGDNNQLSVDFNMSLYDKALKVGITQAELQVQNALLQFDIAKDNLTLRVAERYFDLLGARDSREVARLQKVAIKRQMDLAAERLDVGLGTRTDLFDAKARFQQANADVIAADILINNARQALVEIIAVTPDEVDALAEDSPLELPEPNDIKHWTSLATQNNLQVKAEEVDLLVASHEIDRQRLGRSPTLSVGANGRWSDTASSFSGDSTTTSIGLTVNLPLFLGGAVKLRTEQAGLRFNASEQALELSKRRAQSETTSAFLAVTSGISQVKALEEAILAGESALEAKEEGFSAGLTTNLDVLDAQRDLSRSRTDYLRAKYNYIIALLQLEQATGDLGDEDIKYINRWLGKNNTVYRKNEEMRAEYLAMSSSLVD